MSAGRTLRGFTGLCLALTLCLMAHPASADPTPVLGPNATDITVDGSVTNCFYVLSSPSDPVIRVVLTDFIGRIDFIDSGGARQVIEGNGSHDVLLLLTSGDIDCTAGVSRFVVGNTPGAPPAAGGVFAMDPGVALPQSPIQF